MLRHDQAWPATTGDAMQLLGTERREVELMVVSRRFFTPDRWASFGWPAEDLQPFVPEEPAGSYDEGMAQGGDSYVDFMYGDSPDY